MRSQTTIIKGGTSLQKTLWLSRVSKCEPGWSNPKVLFSIREQGSKIQPAVIPGKPPTGSTAVFFLPHVVYLKSLGEDSLPERHSVRKVALLSEK